MSVQDCGQGKYQPYANRDSCYNCLAGKTSPARSTSYNQCTPCPTGEKSSSGSPCVECPAGKVVLSTAECGMTFSPDDFLDTTTGAEPGLDIGYAVVPLENVDGDLVDDLVTNLFDKMLWKIIKKS